MFDELPNQPEDIFAKTDETAPQVAPPTATPPTSAPATPVAAPTSIQQPQPLPEIPSGRGGLRVVIIILAILVIVVVAFLISWRILTSRAPVVPKDGEVLKQEVLPEPVEGSVEAVEEKEVKEAKEEIDTDKDGLTDSQEAQLGTSAKSADTDGDLLFDREEIEVYGTDPLNADTDKDGYSDGDEVKAGYNPNGPGKLLEVPSGS